MNIFAGENEKSDHTRYLELLRTRKNRPQDPKLAFDG